MFLHCAGQSPPEPLVDLTNKVQHRSVKRKNTKKRRKQAKYHHLMIMVNMLLSQIFQVMNFRDSILSKKRVFVFLMKKGNELKYLLVINPLMLFGLNKEGADSLLPTLELLLEEEKQHL